LAFYLIPLAAVVSFGLIAIIREALGGFGSECPPWEFLIAWEGMMLFVAYMCLRIPFEIKVHDSSRIEIRSVLRRLTLSPCEVISGGLLR
jgi:hypothetical protein